MPKNIQLIPLSALVLNALADGQIDTASREFPVRLGPYFIGPECRRTWQRRASQVAVNPAAAEWVTRIIVDVDGHNAVGRAGFHGPPDDAGMVEVGYAIDPLFRRQGYARAALEALLTWASTVRSITTVRASIHRQNHASQTLVRSCGFIEVADQWDEDDGPEVVYERSSASSPRFASA